MFNIIRFIEEVLQTRTPTQRIKFSKLMKILATHLNFDAVKNYLKIQMGLEIE